jgi:adenosine deaminase
MNILTLPKVLLHDHLDGGLRPATVIELANEYGYKALPSHDEAELASWFNRGAKRNDLVLYLETFAHTVGVMQHKDAIERVATSARSTSLPTAWSTPRCAWRPSCAPSRA